MANDIQLYSCTGIEVKTQRGNYQLIAALGGTDQVLKRDVDFGVIPKTKKPTLFKSGAEKVCKAFGVFPIYEETSCIENIGDNPIFFYKIKCELVKYDPMTGNKYVLGNGFGSANSSEKRCGFQGAYDAANGCLKMSQTRALRAAALSLGGLSDMFTQDLDNEDFMNGSQQLIDSNDDNAPINAKQVKRIFAIAADKGMNVEQAKVRLNALGFASTKEVLQKDYDRVCEAMASDEVEKKPKKEKNE